VTSQENVEIVRRLYRGFADGTTDVNLWHSDAELRPAVFGGGALEGAVYRGHDGVAQFLAIQADTWVSVIAEPLTIRDHGTCLLVKTRIQAVGRASGIQVSDVTWNVFEIRHGKVASLRAFTEQGQALEAVGLSERDAHADS
jgi:ketosteroid isomerase-like protein